MDSEHAATMDRWRTRNEVIESQRLTKKTENAKDRQARKCQWDKEEDIEMGRRDLSGKLLKISPSVPLALLPPPSSSLNIAETSHPK